VSSQSRSSRKLSRIPSGPSIPRFAGTPCVLPADWLCRANPAPTICATPRTKPRLIMMDQSSKALEVTSAYTPSASTHTVKTNELAPSLAVIYIVAVTSRSVYDSYYPLGLTRLLPGSGGAGTFKTNSQMRECTGSDSHFGLASSTIGPLFLSLRLASSLFRSISRAPACGSLFSVPSCPRLNLFVTSRYA
jgi:hypothetical protein